MITRKTGPSMASLNSTSSCLGVDFAVDWIETIALSVTFEIACMDPASASCITFEGTC